MPVKATAEGVGAEVYQHSQAYAARESEAGNQGRYTEHDLLLLWSSDGLCQWIENLE